MDCRENLEKATLNRLKWIDAAKRVAMMMGVAVHLAQAIHMPRFLFSFFSFGAMGVQLFFMMSAYCCCMTYGGQPLGVRYLLKKYARLAPWYVLGVVMYALYWWILGKRECLINFSFWNVVSNLFLVNACVPGAQNSIVPGGWSISCIALFVFAFPVVARISKPWRAVAIMICGLVGVVVSCVGYLYWGWSRFFAYCNPLNQVAVFGAGVALWQFRESIGHRMNDRALLSTSGMFFLFAVAAVMFSKEWAIFYRQLLISASFFFSVIWLGRHENLIPKWLIWTGRHSYEIFIFHFLLIWVLFK